MNVLVIELINSKIPLFSIEHNNKILFSIQVFLTVPNWERLSAGGNPGRLKWNWSRKVFLTIKNYMILVILIILNIIFILPEIESLIPTNKLLGRIGMLLINDWRSCCNNPSVLKNEQESIRVSNRTFLSSICS